MCNIYIYTASHCIGYVHCSKQASFTPQLRFASESKQFVSLVFTHIGNHYCMLLPDFDVCVTSVVHLHMREH